MRISDWSSDVCSADLRNRSLQIGHAAVLDAFALVGHTVLAAGQRFAQSLQVFWCVGHAYFFTQVIHRLRTTRRGFGLVPPEVLRPPSNRCSWVASGAVICWALSGGPTPSCFSNSSQCRSSNRSSPGWTSVVEGKRCAVRVDLGGWRINKKKK